MYKKIITRSLVAIAITVVAAVTAHAATFSFSFDTASQSQTGKAGDVINYYGTFSVDSDSFNVNSLFNFFWNPGDGTGISFHQDVALPQSITPSTPYHGLLFDLTIGAAAEQTHSGTAMWAGQWTSGGQNGNTAYSGQSFNLTVVPEPYEYGLVAVIGLLTLGGYHRFARKEA